jgi:hypothetical protein
MSRIPVATERISSGFKRTGTASFGGLVSSLYTAIGKKATRLVAFAHDGRYNAKKESEQRGIV